MNEDPQISKSRLDKLGSRLRNSPEPNDDDLILLDRYRERFVEVNATVLSKLRETTAFRIESRHKSISSIVAKLRRRQPARLSAIQDIAGARIIVSTLDAQDDLVKKIVAIYPRLRIDDKRERPTFSYRAVHLIIEAPLPFEVQVRTQLQHIWAQLSESLADRYGFDLKYGGGPPSIAATLAEYSELLAEWDRFITDAGASDADVTETVRGFIERLSTIIRGFGSP